MFRKFWNQSVNDLTVGQTLTLLGIIYGIVGAVVAVWELVDRIDWEALKEKLPKRKRYAKLNRKEDEEIEEMF